MSFGESVFGLSLGLLSNDNPLSNADHVLKTLYSMRDEEGLNKEGESKSNRSDGRLFGALSHRALDSTSQMYKTANFNLSLPTSQQEIEQMAVRIDAFFPLESPIQSNESKHDEYEYNFHDNDENSSGDDDGVNASNSDSNADGRRSRHYITEASAPSIAAFIYPHLKKHRLSECQLVYLSLQAIQGQGCSLYTFPCIDTPPPQLLPNIHVPGYTITSIHTFINRIRTVYSIRILLSTAVIAMRQSKDSAQRAFAEVVEEVLTWMDISIEAFKTNGGHIAQNGTASVGTGTGDDGTGAGASDKRGETLPGSELTSLTDVWKGIHMHRILLMFLCEIVFGKKVMEALFYVEYNIGRVHSREREKNKKKKKKYANKVNGVSDDSGDGIVNQECHYGGDDDDFLHLYHQSLAIITFYNTPTQWIHNREFNGWFLLQHCCAHLHRVHAVCSLQSHGIQYQYDDHMSVGSNLLSPTRSMPPSLQRLVMITIIVHKVSIPLIQEVNQVLYTLDWDTPITTGFGPKLESDSVEYESSMVMNQKDVEKCLAVSAESLLSQNSASDDEEESNGDGDDDEHVEMLIGALWWIRSRQALIQPHRVKFYEGYDIKEEQKKQVLKYRDVYTHSGIHSFLPQEMLFSTTLDDDRNHQDKTKVSTDVKDDTQSSNTLPSTIIFSCQNQTSHLCYPVNRSDASLLRQTCSQSNEKSQYVTQALYSMICDWSDKDTSLGGDADLHEKIQLFKERNLAAKTQRDRDEYHSKSEMDVMNRATVFAKEEQRRQKKLDKNRSNEDTDSDDDDDSYGGDDHYRDRVSNLVRDTPEKKEDRERLTLNEQSLLSPTGAILGSVKEGSDGPLYQEARAAMIAKYTAMESELDRKIQKDKWLRERTRTSPVGKQQLQQLYDKEMEDWMDASSNSKTPGGNGGDDDTSGNVKGVTRTGSPVRAITAAPTIMNRDATSALISTRVEARLTEMRLNGELDAPDLVLPHSSGDGNFPLHVKQSPGGTSTLDLSHLNNNNGDVDSDDEGGDGNDVVKRLYTEFPTKVQQAPGGASSLDLSITKNKSQHKESNQSHDGSHARPRVTSVSDIGTDDAIPSKTSTDGIVSISGSRPSTKISQPAGGMASVDLSFNGRYNDDADDKSNTYNNSSHQHGSAHPSDESNAVDIRSSTKVLQSPGGDTHIDLTHHDHQPSVVSLEGPLNTSHLMNEHSQDGIDSNPNPNPNPSSLTHPSHETAEVTERASTKVTQMPGGVDRLDLTHHDHLPSVVSLEAKEDTNAIVQGISRESIPCEEKSSTKVTLPPGGTASIIIEDGSLSVMPLSRTAAAASDDDGDGGGSAASDDDIKAGEEKVEQANAYLAIDEDGSVTTTTLTTSTRNIQPPGGESSLTLHNDYVNTLSIYNRVINTPAAPPDPATRTPFTSQYPKSMANMGTSYHIPLSELIQPSDRLSAEAGVYSAGGIQLESVMVMYALKHRLMYCIDADADDDADGKASQYAISPSYHNLVLPFSSITSSLTECIQAQCRLLDRATLLVLMQDHSLLAHLSHIEHVLLWSPSSDFLGCISGSIMDYYHDCYKNHPEYAFKTALWNVQAVRHAVDRAKQSSHLKNRDMMEYVAFTLTASSSLQNDDEKSDFSIYDGRFSFQNLATLDILYTLSWPLNLILTRRYIQNIGAVTRRLLAINQMVECIRLVFTKLRNLKGAVGSSRGTMGGNRNRQYYHIFREVQCSINSIRDYTADRLRSVANKFRCDLLKKCDDGVSGLTHVMESFAQSLNSSCFVSNNKEGLNTIEGTNRVYCSEVRYGITLCIQEVLISAAIILQYLYHHSVPTQSVSTPDESSTLNQLLIQHREYTCLLQCCCRDLQYSKEVSSDEGKILLMYLEQ